MRKHILYSATLCAALLATGLVTASPDAPLRYSPRSLDRGLVTLQNPVDGRTVAVWSYRVAGQYDVAISIREAGSAVWSEPQIFGSADALQQEQPTLIFDSAGNAYVAYSVRETGQILLTTLREGAHSWAAPIAVSVGTGRRASPRLRVVGTRLVVAYRFGTTTEIVDLPLLAPEQIGTAGGNDGPDTLPGNHNTIPPPDDDDGDMQRNR